MICYQCARRHGRANVPYCSARCAEKARRLYHIALAGTCQDVRWNKEQARHLARWDALQKEAR